MSVGGEAAAAEDLQHASQPLVGVPVRLREVLEDVLGPLWVFLGFGEVPSLWTFIGGALLLATLAVHEVYLGLRAAGEETADAPPPSAAGGASETKGTCSTLPVVEVASA